jgi:hypothetical protein
VSLGFGVKVHLAPASGDAIRMSVVVEGCWDDDPVRVHVYVRACACACVCAPASGDAMRMSVVVEECGNDDPVRRSPAPLCGESWTQYGEVPSVGSVRGEWAQRRFYVLILLCVCVCVCVYIIS